MKKSIIIVAGGKGLRMGGDIPKQFLPVHGKPVLMHTMEVFRTYDEQIQIVLVLPKDQQEYWKELCNQYHFTCPYVLADGGETRFHSVQNGLACVQNGGVVGVHDGVRPLVSTAVIDRCYAGAALHKAVIPVIGVVETVRHLTAQGSETVLRGQYRLVQTPQVFDTDLLKRAYQQTYTSAFTDDASVVEALGEDVCLVEGNRENIKLTTPFDLKLAEILFSERGNLHV